MLIKKSKHEDIDIIAITKIMLNKWETFNEDLL